MPAAARALPLQLTSFVGRRRELRDLLRQVSTHRLITLCGVAGVGKTRLAVEIARRAGSAFSGGVTFVDLAPVSGGEALAPRIAIALGLRGRRAAGPDVDAVADAIGSRQVLLVLDNCEHLVGACGEVAGALLATCPGLTVITTSREPLGVTGELRVAVSPLPLPDAVQLLYERTSDAVSRVTDTQLAERLCTRLDGLPLALELAAVRLRSMTLNDVVERLDSRFHLLSSSTPVLGARHTSLSTAIDWSHDLLGQPERVLFRRLSVFAGRFRLVDVEAICAWQPLDRHDVAALLSHLVDRSMVGYDGSHYLLLQTLREYSRNRAVEAVEHEKLARRHADHYLRAVTEEPSGLGGVHLHVRALMELMHQEDNLRGALDWLLANRPPAYSRMVGALSVNWAHRGNVWDQRLHCSRALELPSTPAAERVQMLIGLSASEFLTGNYDSAERFCSEAVDIARRIAGAGVLCEALGWLGVLMTVKGDHASAEALLSEALEAGERCGNAGGAAAVRLYRGLLALLQGDVVQSLELLLEAERGLRANGRVFQLAQTLVEVGRTELVFGDRVAARDHLAEGLRLSRDLDSPFLCALGLEGMGAFLAAGSDPTRALELAAAGAASRAELGVTMPPVYEMVISALLDPARQRLGERAATAWRRGSTMSLTLAVDNALDEHGESPPGMSRRQQEVADLVAAGLSNREIAARLHLSVRTVEDHVEAVLNRLGFERRSQIASYVTQGELAKIP